MPACKFGAGCYRKNEEHLREFHPEKLKKKKEEESKNEENAATGSERPTKKRKMDEEEKEAEKRAALKLMRDETDEFEEEKEAEEDDFIHDECEPVEEIVESADMESDEREDTVVDVVNTSPRKRRLPNAYPHRSPFLHQPRGIYSLWKKAVAFLPEDPRGAFAEINGARLVGFFDFLAGDLDQATDDEIRIHARFPTDLPEMQTIVVTDAGRYALWRDDPKQETALIVFAKHGDDHFTKITLLGDKPIHALVHAAAEGAECMLERFYPVALNKWSSLDKIRLDAKAAIARRNKSSLGRPLHGMRLWVHVDANDVGYRSLGEDLNKLKRTLTMVGETTDDVVRKKKMAELREIGTTVELANDECDFGTGLEFGHDLFCANYPVLDGMARRYLATAYQLLNRVEFGAIVDAQMEMQVRRRENVMITGS